MEEDKEKKRRDDQVEFNNLKKLLIKTGVSAAVFASEDSVYKNRHEIQQNYNKSFLLGDFKRFVEAYLKLTSKRTAGEGEYNLYSGATFTYWCESCGIEPREGANQTLDKTSRNFSKKGGRAFGVNCLLTCDQAVKMLCYLFRFKLYGSRSTEPIEEFEDVANCALLFLIGHSEARQILLLREFTPV